MLVISGAPQGNVLGTLMFAIYINDLPDDRVFSDCFLFADDSKLLCALLQLNSDLQADVTTFKNWAGQNLMKFITAKRRVVRFSSNPTWPLHITLNSEPITKTDYIRDLGVFIEKSLNWNKNADKKIEKAYKAFIKTNGSSYSRVLFLERCMSIKPAYCPLSHTRHKCGLRI